MIPSNAVSQSFYVYVRYFEEPLSVRVSKNIVANTAWWNAYVYNPIGFDVNFVVRNFLAWLSNWNFISPSVNVWDLSHLWKSLSSSNASILANPTFNDKIEKTWSWEKTAISNYKTDILSSWMNTSITNQAELISRTVSLWDDSKIRVLKNWSLEISYVAWSSFDMSWIKTVVIENWDLIVNRDMKYLWSDDSFAFIVKNWNIVVDSQVKKIAWVFVVMNWVIASAWWETVNQLSVDWSLYWDASMLSDSRSYVRWTSAYSALSSWVLINYSNRALKNPPPMLVRFIEQYWQKKVAK